jgi:hypothetical protein
MQNGFEELLARNTNKNTIIFYNIVRPLIRPLEKNKFISLQNEKRLLFFEVCKYFGKSYKCDGNQAILLAVLFLNEEDYEDQADIKKCTEFANERGNIINHKFSEYGYDDSERFSYWKPGDCYHFSRKCTAPNCIYHGSWNSQCSGASSKEVYVKKSAPQEFSRESLMRKYPELFQRYIHY